LLPCRQQHSGANSRRTEQRRDSLGEWLSSAFPPPSAPSYQCSLDIFKVALVKVFNFATTTISLRHVCWENGG
ncbi:hypothetical protein INR49_025412, partial [Caranx melampygus]